MNEIFEPEITILYCGRGLEEGARLPEGSKKGDGFRVRFAMMPCSSKVEVEYLVKLIEKGADAVTLVTCPADQCQFMLGSIRAGHRVTFARRLLEEAGIGADRMASVEAHNLSAEAFMSIASEQAARLKTLGRNPMKVAR